MDTLPEGVTGAVYDLPLIHKMCEDAIAQVLITNPAFRDRVTQESGVVAKSHLIVVEGINNSRVCMAVSTQSCFPKSIRSLTKNIGDTCEELRQSDDL